MRRLIEIDGDSLLRGQRGNDIAGRPAAESIKAVFVQGDAVSVGHSPPAPVVGGHGVGERAVAVKEQRVVILEEPHERGPADRLNKRVARNCPGSSLPN